jgi:hypothetical protein
VRRRLDGTARGPCFCWETCSEDREQEGQSSEVPQSVLGTEQHEVQSGLGPQFCFGKCPNRALEDYEGLPQVVRMQGGRGASPAAEGQRWRGIKGAEGAVIACWSGTKMLGQMVPIWAAQCGPRQS